MIKCCNKISNINLIIVSFSISFEFSDIDGKHKSEEVKKNDFSNNFAGGYECESKKHFFFGIFLKNQFQFALMANFLGR